MYLDVKAGDFKKTKCTYGRQSFFLFNPGFFSFTPKRIMIDQVETMDVIHSGQEYKFGRTLGVGALGAAFFGPLGAVVGAAASKAQRMTVKVYFKDGRKVLFETNAANFKEMLTDMEAANF